MSFPTELILGLVGTLTGILGLFFHILKYRREKPRLEGGLDYCSHSYEEDAIKFKPIVDVRNIGSSPSTIFKTELWAQLIALNPKDSGEEQIGVGGVDYKGIVRVEPNDTVELQPVIELPLLETFKPNQERIEFVLIIYHTLGDFVVDGVSKLTEIDQVPK